MTNKQLMMTSEQLETLKAAALAATQDAWISVDEDWSDGDQAEITTENRIDGCVIAIAQVSGGGSESELDEPFRSEQQANARYIAAVNPPAILALVNELEASYRREENYRKKWVDELANLQEAGKRIAELESQLQSGFTSEALAQEERAENAEQRIAELEARLPMPVQLPEVRFIKVSGKAVAIMSAERVKEQLAAARVHVEQEGGDDEER